MQAFYMVVGCLIMAGLILVNFCFWIKRNGGRALRFIGLRTSCTGVASHWSHDLGEQVSRVTAFFDDPGNINRVNDRIDLVQAGMTGLEFAVFEDNWKMASFVTFARCRSGQEHVRWSLTDHGISIRRR